MTALTRPLIASDLVQWNQLWEGYLDFYNTTLPSGQTERTWQRLVDPAFGLHCLIAELEGQIVGFAHYSFTHSTWGINRDLYLEDLFIDLSVRGQGLGKLLFTGLGEIAKAEGSRKIYWETHEHNKVARKLYDSVGELSEFVKYSIRIE